MIHLICTLEPTRIALLPQLIQHYAQLGVERFHFSLQVEPTTSTEAVEQSRSAANSVLRAWDAELNTVLIVPFTAQALREHHDRLVKQYCREDDWVLWTDIDEFQVYPGEFKSLLHLADRFSIDYFRGHFVDRVATNGKLKDFDPSVSVWTQYPRRFRPDPRIPLGLTEKVTCARPKVQLNPGNHFPVNNEVLRYYSEEVEVHHFKWDLAVRKRLERRLQPDFQALCPWWVESKTVLDFLAEHDDCIAID